MSLKTYWEKIYQGRDAKPMAELAAVCCPQAPHVYNRMFDAFQRRTVLRLLDVVRPLYGKVILDLGCGFGRWTRLLRAQGVSVIGVDHALVPLVRNRVLDLRAPFAQMKLPDLCVRDQSVDGVVSVTVLQHLPHIEQRLTIRELQRCVRPGGFVLLLEHTGGHEGTNGDLLATTFPNPPSRWIEMFVHHGFSLLESRPCLVLPIFRVYWRVRATLRRYLWVRPATMVKRGTPDVPTVQGVYGRLNFLAYALLTPPSYLLERLIEAVPHLKDWMSQRLPVPQRGFLFRREGK